MIDKAMVLSFAQQAGFDGVDRVKNCRRLMHFAELVAEWKAEQDTSACRAVGDMFKPLGTEFSDGQMDGAYRCAEILQGEKDEKS